MFEREIKFNVFLLGYFDKVIADIPADRLTERTPGNGHPPVWVLGHLAICAELGQKFLGGELTHPDWAAAFGPGSSDEVTDPRSYHKDEFVDVIRTGYPRLGEMLAAASEELLTQLNGVDVLAGSPIETIGDLEVHLLTTHFAFHLSQLSAWRRAAGYAPLF